MTNICMIAKDRLKLTLQALDSLRKHTDPSLYNLTLIDDGSIHRTVQEAGTLQTVEERFQNWENAVYVRISRSRGIVGLVRNLSVLISEQYWGRGGLLALFDNDIFFLPGWLEKMTSLLVDSGARRVEVLGGYRHPFHKPNDTLYFADVRFSNQDPRAIGTAEEVSRLELTDAVAGYSQLMRWNTWNEFGPFDAHAQGVCQSEDFAFCQKIIKDGGLVGYIDPPVIVNAGLTNSEGKPAIGSEQFPRVEGVYYE